MIGFVLGIPYAAPWGHRGATHSLIFAAFVGVTFVSAQAVLNRQRAGAARAAAFAGILATIVVASHGLLDALTDGGLGAALLWPFTENRYFAPWNPIPVSPIGLRVLSPYGIGVALYELLLFSPMMAYALWSRRHRT